jgi:hypothetical protein
MHPSQFTTGGEVATLPLTLPISWENQGAMTDKLF